jgi:hypothetical protein
MGGACRKTVKHARDCRFFPWAIVSREQTLTFCEVLLASACAEMGKIAENRGSHATLQIVDVSLAALASSISHAAGHGEDIPAITSRRFSLGLARLRIMTSRS